jgi:molybdate transport system ATP-binding protein
VVEGGVLTQTGTPEEIRLAPKTAYAADLAGSNLYEGIAEAGDVDVGGHLLHIADQSMAGPVLVTIRPAAVTVHRTRPEGSPRNAWVTAVEALEPLGERVRIRTGGPLALTVEITRAATDELDLAAGAGIWVSIKATEIGVEVSG